MAKIKPTKSELRTQRLELQRYLRFLPTLQLKKQQLQEQVDRVQKRLLKVRNRERELWKHLEPWIALFAEDMDLSARLQISEAGIVQHNVLGLKIQGLDRLVFADPDLDLWTTPPWVDDGLEALKEAVRLQLKLKLLSLELDMLRAELRKASQRVNLFEKVKIPECREHIRLIRIVLGDVQTMAVARAKLAKAKMQERSSAT